MIVLSNFRLCFILIQLQVYAFTISPSVGRLRYDFFYRSFFLLELFCNKTPTFRSVLMIFRSNAYHFDCFFLYRSCILLALFANITILSSCLHLYYRCLGARCCITFRTPFRRCLRVTFGDLEVSVDDLHLWLSLFPLFSHNKISPEMSVSLTHSFKFNYSTYSLAPFWGLM